MKKIVKLLENVNDVNNFYEVEQFEHVNGNAQTLYFRLTSELSGNCHKYQRWIPSMSAQCTVTFDSLDCANVVRRAATMAFPNDDRSVWMVQLTQNDIIMGNMRVELYDGGTRETLLLEGRLIGSSTGSSRFYA
jgi:hypothetical protein